MRDELIFAPASSLAVTVKDVAGKTERQTKAGWGQQEPKERQTKGRTDEQTERQTSRQTDRRRGVRGCIIIRLIRLPYPVAVTGRNSW